MSKGANDIALCAELAEGVKDFCDSQNGRHINPFTSKDLMPNVSDYEKWLGIMGSITLLTSINMLWKRKDWNSLYIGKSGSGKSTSLFLVMEELYEEYDILPLHIDMERCIRYKGKNKILQYICENYINSFESDIEEKDIGRLIYAKNERTEKPKVILMLDGLSSCNGGDVGEMQREIKNLQRNGALQTIMTSASTMHPFALGNIATQRFDFEKLTKAQIDAYLAAFSIEKEGIVPYEILSNPLILTIYAETNNFMERYTGKETQYIRRVVKTEGDILWNSLEMYTLRFSENKTTEVEQIKMMFWFRFVLPYIAYYMEKKVKNTIWLGELSECVNSAVNLLKDVGFCNVFKEYFAFTNMEFDNAEVITLVENVVNETGLLIENKDESFSFSTQIMKSFFAAAYVYRILIYKNRTRQKAEELEVKMLNPNALRFLGELTYEYHNRPIKEHGKWTMPQEETEIVNALALYRNQFDGDAKKAVANLVMTMKIARGDNLAGVDLSGLDLRRNTFTNIVCSVSDAEKTVTTKFEGAMIDRWMFGTVGFCNDLSCCRVCGDMIAATNGNGIVSVYDIHTGQKEKEYDTEDVFVQSLAFLSPEEILISCLNKGVMIWTWKTGVCNPIMEYIPDTRFHKVEYLGNGKVSYITRDRNVFFFDAKRKKYDILSINANHIFMSRNGQLLITTRGRQILEYDLKSRNATRIYPFEEVDDVYATKAIITEDEKTIIFSTKNGNIVEWERGEIKHKTVYELASSVNDFCLSDDQNFIFCPTENGCLWCIDRKNGTKKEVLISTEKERRWGSIDRKEDILILSSIEGAVCLYEYKEDKFKVLQEDCIEYRIPFLTMRGCSFKNLHPDVHLDENLKKDLQKQGIEI